MTQPKKRFDLARLMFGILFILVMIVVCLWVVRPFILGFAWAGMVVIATWPLLLRVQKYTGGRRTPAVIFMTLLLVVVFVLPFGLVINSIVDNSGQLVDWVGKPENWHIPKLAWLNDIPGVGRRLYRNWQAMTADNGKALVASVQPYAGAATTWFVSQVAHVGGFMLHGTLMVVFSALLYAKGEAVAKGIRHFALRLAEKRGEAAVILGAQAIRAVALGVVVTALTQALLGGIGLAISGIPYATLLTVLMFICCLAQIGPSLILFPAVFWLYWSGDNTWGTVLLVWSCVVVSMDNFLRPALIRLGADLPLLLILSGVIGGLLAFGMIGLFIGPVVLAVSYRLISAWIDEVPEPTDELPDLERDLNI
ncbi:AI-2E family transporter YdiK [Limnobaculum zhutongyuii]|uniref:AI-2E family transporter YdiK n=1 Tax=Limnobaculum zhutongyuii TaxID=2498113 RepID=A0A411WJ74_9GAMM|nr:AI-2E family transporter YdiK [Limnobaculum zhutongyuii]QBH96243.1 AI-2E family transporter YdiK [Limnobaculum zhutongyuii]TQS87169.1 AI-2E family transporter YdiK [Limnobaculum zhutongyuii]